MKKILLITALALLTACNNLDPYAAAFPKIEIGDTRVRVIELMGEPTLTNSTEVPLISVENLTWKSPANARSYVVHVIANRVVRKVINQ